MVRIPIRTSSILFGLVGSLAHNAAATTVDTNLLRRTLTAALFEFECDRRTRRNRHDGKSYTTTVTFNDVEADFLYKGGQHCDSGGNICFSATVTNIDPAPTGNACVYYANDNVCMDFSGSAVDGNNQCGYTIGAEVPNGE
ncbi:hypothetical protein B0H13DRAFT_2654502 [Mycena leptocephala]|nr:hypothetical protein B0H13DRAFT_2654502 [Mycena leptocephala]